jgi:hypothetical protein
MNAKIVVLLEEEIKLNTHNHTAGSDVNYLQRNENSTQLEDNGRCSVVRPKRHKRNRDPQQFKIPLLVNRVVVPLEKFPDVTEIQGKTIIKCGAVKEKPRKQRVLLLGDSQVRGCADLL